MKNMFILSVLISFEMICSCQKQDSTAEAQLAQRKVELDAREQALDKRDKALVEREKAVANTRPIRPELQSWQQARDPAELEAERERKLQQLPPELRALIPDRSQVNPANIAKDREAALQGQASDPAQVEAERQKRIQQLPPEVQALIRDRSLLDPRTAEKSKGTEDRAVQLQRSLEEARRKKMNAIASPDTEVSDAQPSSPSPSPTPE